MGRLDGVRVLDLSRLLPGPAATAWLAGQGAVVDRVETPGRGDFARHIPPFVDGVGAYFAATSRGKRSLAVDLRHDEGPALLRALVPHYDVLVEGFRPGVMEAMGLGPDALHALHPGLVVARLSGFGQTGPWAQRPGHDVNYLGLAGALDGVAPGPNGLPIPWVQVADQAGALVAAAGIASALYARERTGRGDVLDISLTEAALWFANPAILGETGEGGPTPRGQHILSGGLPMYGTYACADGRWITLGALEPKFQARLATAVDGDLGAEALRAAFAAKPRDAWVEALAEACVGPVLSPAELADHPQHTARQAVRQLGASSWVRPPLGDLPEGAPPALGADSDEVLADAGLDVARWRANGVLG